MNTLRPAYSSIICCLLVLLGWSNLVNSQTFELNKGDTINRVDVNGLRQGMWMIYNKNGSNPAYKADQLMEEVHYKDSKKDGIRRQFYPNGKLKSEIPFSGNVPRGKSKTFFQNGNLSEEGTWKNGGWDGSYKYYYENGNLSYEWNFINGKREGEQIYYFPNGQLNYIGTWKNGTESGVLKEYNDSGLLVAEKNFNEGKLDEASTKYYSTPQVDKSYPIQTPTTTDKAGVGVFDGNGYFKLKTKTGQISKEGKFAAGQLVEGNQYHYSAEGKLLRTVVYKEGKVQQTIEE